ncbi:hypothetical protein HP532_15640 [Pseudomonas sp. CrR25]|nr:hypothetical protein [Pseudomonas sp. CrR25]
MREIKVNSFHGFIQKIEEISASENLVIFRGQAFEGGLLPSIARKNPKKNTTEIEKNVIDQLQLMGA